MNVQLLFRVLVMKYIQRIYFYQILSLNILDSGNLGMIEDTEVLGEE